MIVLKNVNKSYISGQERIRVLIDCNLHVAKGRTAIILGPSGSGKSSLLNIIGGIDRVDSGTIEIGGQEVSGFTEEEFLAFRRHNIGIVFQSFHLIHTLNALDNIALPLILSGVPHYEAQKKALQYLHYVHLEHRKHAQVMELSGGEQQRIAIARALVTDPCIVLADEPTGNLDPKSSEEVAELLQKVSRECTQTILLVTHNHNLLQLGDALFHFRGGQLVAK